MSILFSGDFRSNDNYQLQLITKKSLVNGYGSDVYNAIKSHVMLGDAAFMWQQKNDKSNYEALAHRPFPILCVMGNFEPIYGMGDKREIDIGIGETVYQIQDKPFVAYLKRGKAYTIDGFRFLVLGGALTINKKKAQAIISRNDCFIVSFWEDEYWSQEEKTNVFRLLETENAFDFVISHTGPHQINRLLFGNERQGRYHPHYFQDEVAFLNDQINEKIRFKKWLCGHWFRDEYHFDDKTQKAYQYLYRETRIIERIGDRVVTRRKNETVKI
jgi:hypothetical protein